MERPRPAPPLSLAEMDPSGPIKRRPSLNELIQHARSPDATRVEVDALLRGLARPAPADQSPREHADLLLSLIEDPQLGSATGGNGRSVRATAVKALMALGYPYALEVPPEALTGPEPTHAAAPRSLFTGRIILGSVILGILGLTELMPILLAAKFLNHPRDIVVYGTSGMLATTFLPTLVTLMGHGLESPGLRKAGLGWLVLAGLAWMVAGVTVLGDIVVLPLGIGGLTLFSAWVLKSKS